VKVVRNRLCVGLWLFFFLIAPAPAYAFSFAVFGDSCKGDATYEKLLKKTTEDPDISFAIHLGDFALNGQLKEYEKHIKFNRLCGIPIYHVKGNHDAVYSGYKYFSFFLAPRIFLLTMRIATFLFLTMP